MLADPITSDAKAIIDMARLGEPRVFSGPDGRQFLTMPGSNRDGTIYTRTIGLPTTNPEPPDNLRTTVSFTALASFLHYLKTAAGLVEGGSPAGFGPTNLLIFADIGVGSSYVADNITAVIDYPGFGNAALRGLHRARWDFPFSEQWKRWMNASAKLLSQTDLAEFLQENAPDIVEPDAATLQEAVLNMSIRRKVVFDSAKRLQDGTQEYTFKEENDTGSKSTIRLPEKIAIGIPVLFGGRSYRIEFWLRHRLNDGRVSFAIQPHRPEYIRQDAVDEAIGEIEAALGITVLRGNAPAFTEDTPQPIMNIYTVAT